MSAFTSPLRRGVIQATLAAFLLGCLAAPPALAQSPRAGQTSKAAAHSMRASRTSLNRDSQGRAGTRNKYRSSVKSRAKGPKLVSPEKAASLIKGGTRVWIPVGQVTSNVILKTLAAQIKSGKQKVSSNNPVEIVGLSNTASRRVFDRSGKVVPRALFIGSNVRDPLMAGRGGFVPAYFGRIPRLIREGKVPVDVAVVQVSKPDSKGYVTLGPTAGATIAALEHAKTIVAQVNENMPRTYGATRIHKSKLDYIVKANDPMVEVPPAKITPTDKKIASHIVKLVLQKQAAAHKPRRDLLNRSADKLAGKRTRRSTTPTFQFGIGGIPDAVAGQLATAKGLKGCKVRSELIGAGTQKLVDAGKVRGKVVYTFAMGDKSFLKWMDGNRKLVAQPVDVVNDVAKIAATENMVAINSAMKVDLNGQINAQYIRNSWYSGVGGQVDFMRGAMGSSGGKAIIALPSSAVVKDGKGGTKLVSKIVPRLGESDVVTTNMHDVQHVVTEYGVASLEGKTDVQRARALIKVAHPQFRKELTRALDDQIAARKAAEQKKYDAYQMSKKQ